MQESGRLLKSEQAGQTVKGAMSSGRETDKGVGEHRQLNTEHQGPSVPVSAPPWGSEQDVYSN